MTTVHDVAAYLLAQRQNMATMKLHKLAYYATGWHLAWTGEALFPETVEARKSGPVVPALFDPISTDTAVVDSWRLGDAGQLNTTSTDIVDAVLKNYGHLTGISMSEMSRGELPWILARKGAGDDAPYPALKHSHMRAFFRALDDAPADRVQYANRFADKYTDTVIGR